jgi:hypothetical protein
MMENGGVWVVLRVETVFFRPFLGFGCAPVRKAAIEPLLAALASVA